VSRCLYRMLSPLCHHWLKSGRRGVCDRLDSVSDRPFLMWPYRLSYVVRTLLKTYQKRTLILFFFVVGPVILNPEGSRYISSSLANFGETLSYVLMLCQPVTFLLPGVVSFRNVFSFRRWVVVVVPFRLAIGLGGITR